MKKKVIALVLTTVLLLGATVGVTLAYLTDKTAVVENTFTVGKVDIKLIEHDKDNNEVTARNDYKIVPGNTETKDPTLTVIANSEDCWVFVEIEETNNTTGGTPEKFVEWAIASGWTKLDSASSGTKTVYYREYITATTDTSYPVLLNNKVSFNADLTSTQLATITDNKKPSLKFTGYAVQKANVTTKEAAWTAASSTSNTPILTQGN